MAKAKPVLPALETGPVTLAPIRATSKKQLIDLIDSRRGKKALVLDPSLSGPLTLLDAGLSELLTEHGVAKLLYLERTRLDDATYNAAEPRLSDLRPVIYVARATLENAQTIAWQVRQSIAAGSGSSGGMRSSGKAAVAGSGSTAAAAAAARPPSVASSGASTHEFSVYWVPRRSVAVERVLEEEGVYGDITQGEFPLDMVALDDDVLSLELEAPARECTLEGDSSSLYAAACALIRLQGLYGLIPRLQGKGPAAAAVKDMALRLRRESPLPPAAAAACRIHRAVLLDREVDPVTPLLTQITFEGLIDEVTGIRHGSVSYTPGRRDGPGAAAAPGPVGGEAGSGATGGTATAAGSSGGRGRGGGSTLLNSSDPFYKEFRDLPYYVTSQRLQSYARDARREYAQLGSRDLSGLASFVKGLPQLLLLDRLSDLAVPVAAVVRQQSFHDRLKAEADMLEGYDTEESVTFIMRLMQRGSDAVTVLRLLCLLSATAGGLPRRHADALRSEFLVTYGHQHLLTLTNLERAGLLKPQAPGPRSQWPTLRKALRLTVPEEGDTPPDNPSDIAHLYKGYAPISLRLVEAALGRGGWGPHAEALSLLPGAQFDVLQVLDPSGLVMDKPFRAAMGDIPAAGAGGEPETVLLVMLGGITFTEVSALRWLASQPGSGVRFLVLTSRMLSGRSLLESFIDPPARCAREL